MYHLIFCRAFKKHFAVYKQNRPAVSEKMKETLPYFEKGLNLPPEFNDHPLRGKVLGKKGVREFHLFPDILVVYQRVQAKKLLYFLSVGSHGDFFDA